MTTGSGLFSNQRGVRPIPDGRSGLPGEVADLRRDVANTLAPVVASTIDRMLAPEAASTTAIYDKADVDIGGTGLVLTAAPPRLISFAVPRQLVLTTIASANWDVATSITIVGTDASGNRITENLTVASASTLTTVRFFKTWTSITIPAQTAAIANAIDIGIGTRLGLSKRVAEHGTGGATLLEEYIGDVLVTGANVRSDQFTPDPPAADADELFTAAVGVLGTAAVEILPAAFDGTGGGYTDGVLDHPVNVTFTSTAGAVGSAIVDGRDVYGNVMRESVVLVGGGLATGARSFKRISKITLPAQAAAGDTVTAGIGSVLGPSFLMAVAAGGAVPIILQELVDGAAPGVAGALTAPATNPPNGGYTPNAGPSGSNAYSLAYCSAVAGSVVGPTVSGEAFGYYVPVLAADGRRNYSLVYEYVPTA
jgi:hypothetical protein